MTQNTSPHDALHTDLLGAVAHRPGSLIWMGALLIALGCVGIIAETALSLAAAGLMGGFAVIAGLMQAFHVMQVRGWRSVSLQLALALLYIVSGLLVWVMPQAALASLTLCLAVLFVLTGALRIRLALQHQALNGWWLPLISGLLSLLLGGLILIGWPADALWLPGLIIGIELCLHGSALLALGLMISRAVRH